MKSVGMSAPQSSRTRAGRRATVSAFTGSGYTSTAPRATSAPQQASKSAHAMAAASSQPAASTLRS